MKNVFAIFALISFGVLPNSCALYRHNYAPNGPVIPFITKQHDAVASVAACNYDGRELQALYSPLKHMFVMYNYMNLPYNRNKYGDCARSRFQEGGIGGYWTKKIISFHLLGGFGAGDTKHVIGYLSGGGYLKSHLYYRRWFVQPGLVLQGKGMRLGIVFRQIWLHHHAATLSFGGASLPSQIEKIRRIEENTPLCIPEIGFSIGAQIRPFTFSLNVAGVWGNQKFFENYHFSPSNQNVMLSLNLNEIWERKSKRKTIPTNGN
jgi:hypothetical protein